MMTRISWQARWALRLAVLSVVALGLTAAGDFLGAQPKIDPLMDNPPPVRGRAVPLTPEPIAFDEPGQPLQRALPAESPVAFQDAKELPKSIEIPPPQKMPKSGTNELPPPKATQFGPNRPRMERLGQGPLGTTPVATEEDLKTFNKYIKEVIDPRHTLDLVVGRTRIILLNETPRQIQVADDSIVGYNLLEPKQMIIVGRQAGSTVLTMWFRDANDGTDKILSYLVRVIPDPEVKLRLEAIYDSLEKEINKKFPDSRIELELVGDKVAVSGQSKDVAEATHILRIIRGNIPNDTARLPISNINLNVNAADLLNTTGTPGIESFLAAGGPNIINLLRIPGEQQVMLKVTVAEVNRTAARSIGINFNFINNQGTNVFGQQTGGITVGGSVLQQNQNQQGGVIANLPIILDQGQIPIAISALKALNYARSLAEPNLVAMNGQTASFQSGGSFPVPVIGGFGGGGGGGGGGGANPTLTGVQYIPFGVLLNFTPIITDRDRIRLNVQANVSTRDNSTGTSIGGAQVPGLNSRNFTTTVEMREGQTLAVAGLIQTNIAAQTSRVPFLGDIPIFNRFMGYDRLQSGEQELVILITPELVHPLEKKEVTKVPGADLFEPSDLEFFLYGKLESRRTYDYRSQAMTDIHRMARYHKAEQVYLFGPVGHTDDPNYPFSPYDQYPTRFNPPANFP